MFPFAVPGVPAGRQAAGEACFPAPHGLPTQAAMGRFFARYQAAGHGPGG